jgi:hypothetical protein
MGTSLFIWLLGCLGGALLCMIVVGAIKQR